MCDRNKEIPCKQKPCEPPRCKPESQDDVNAGLKGRPVLYTGVVWIGLVRRFLIPRSCLRCPDPNEAKHPEKPPPKAVAHVQPVDSSPLHEPPLRYKPKPTPVPLVTEEPQEPNGPVLRRRRDDGDAPKSPLKALVVQVHEASAAAAAHARGITQDLGSILRDGQGTTAEVIETVRSEDGQRFRMAAISASSLVGYLAGMKRGVVARLVFSATGATAMATICYPEDTKTYNRRGLARVRRWIVLGLSFVQPGPQKPLGSGDLKITNNSHLFDNNETQIVNTEQSQPVPSATGNVITNLMQNLESLGNRIGEIKARLKESSTKTVANESATENSIDSIQSGVSGNETETYPPESLPQSSDMDKQFQNYSSSNGTNPPDSVPYSPALPVPPKVNPSRSKLNFPPPNPDDDHVKRTVHTTTSKSRMTREQFPQEVDELTDGVDDDEYVDEDDDDLQQDDGFDNYLDRTFVIPTGGLEEKLEGGQERLKKTGLIENDEKPLNKKLSGYYRHMPEEQKTSREKDYNDAYSNRGK